MLALKYSRNPEVAADAVQETCASVIQHIDNFRGQSRFFLGRLGSPSIMCECSSENRSGLSL